jgi:multidrug efflux pump
VVSQMLTLYTTPVVYLALDRLRLRVMGKQRDNFNPDDGAIAAASD